MAGSIADTRLDAKLPGSHGNSVHMLPACFTRDVLFICFKKEKLQKELAKGIFYD